MRRRNPDVATTLRSMTNRSFPGKTPHDINRGSCDTWAFKAEEELGGGEVIWLLDQYGVFEEYTKEPDGWGHDPSQKDHCVLLYKGRYYDAETPAGVTNFRDLPYVKVGGRRQNPDDKALLRRLTVEVDDEDHNRGYLELRAYDGDRQVATGYFAKSATFATAHDIQVAKDWRRRGVASWLYRRAEKHLGVPVRHSIPRHQTTDGKAFAKGRRKNPPADYDSPEVLTGECTVWAISAASGKSLGAVRKVFVDAGIDMWSKDWRDKAGGANVMEIRRAIRALDMDRRIVSVGFDAINAGPRAKMSEFMKDSFLAGRGAETFGHPNAEAATVQAHMNVGQIVRKAEKEGLAAIVIVGEIKERIVRALPGSYPTRKRVISGNSHAVGYSPKMGVYDTAVSNPHVFHEDYRALRDDLRVEGGVLKGEPITGWHWHAHGDVVPGSMRRALMWVLFKGE